MKHSREQLEQVVRDLRARGSHDQDSLSMLCQTLWLLGSTEEAVSVFCVLLDAEPPAADPAFDTAYLAGLRATGTCPVPLGRRYRLMEAFELLRRTAAVAGEVAECGCFRGMSSYVLCSAIRCSDPSFDGSGYHIFDSFQGLSEPTADDEVPEEWENADRVRGMSRKGSFAASLETVKSNLRAFPRIAYYPGWIPLSFKGLPERSYRFVHVDVDLYDPTLDAFHYFYPRLAPGGYIISDDYSWPGARTAVDEFVAETGVRLRVTAHKQAIVQKGA